MPAKSKPTKRGSSIQSATAQETNSSALPAELKGRLFQTLIADSETDEEYGDVRHPIGSVFKVGDLSSNQCYYCHWLHAIDSKGHIVPASGMYTLWTADELQKHARLLTDDELNKHFSLLKGNYTLKAQTAKRTAFVAVIDGSRFGVGLAEEDEPGYYPQHHLGDWPTYEEASRAAQTYNLILGLGTEEAARIVCSSMRKR